MDASKRFSPHVLTDLFERASADLADFFEALPFEAPALFGVSWAGEQTSEGWFDLKDPRYLHAVLEISVRGLPHAYRQVRAAEGETVVIQVDGAAGGVWTLLRENNAWTIWNGVATAASARVRLSDQAAWRLLYNALPPAEAAKAVTTEGRPELTSPLLRARTIVVNVI